MPIKSRAEVRAEFARRGWSISGWAKQHGYSPVLVSDILNDNEANPKRKCLRGESHNIAVALEIKQGLISRAAITTNYATAAA